MASFSGTTAVLEIESGTTTFSPPRFSGSPAVLRIVGGNAGFTILGTPTTPRIERLQRFEPGNSKGRVDFSGAAQTGFREQVVQQRNAEGIEKAFQDLQAQVVAVEQVLNLTREALRTATAVQARVTIANSYTDPPSVVTASSAGVVTIAAHIRRYGDGTSVSVDAGSVSGFAPGDTVTVFYRDAARAGGAVLFETSMKAVAQENDIHVVGRASIPEAGSPPASGGGPTSPGYVPPPPDSPPDLYDTII